MRRAKVPVTSSARRSALDDPHLFCCQPRTQTDAPKAW